MKCDVTINFNCNLNCELEINFKIFILQHKSKKNTKNFDQISVEYTMYRCALQKYNIHICIALKPRRKAELAGETPYNFRIATKNLFFGYTSLQIMKKKYLKLELVIYTEFELKKDKILNDYIYINQNKLSFRDKRKYSSHIQLFKRYYKF